jgi:uncharacterized short protein YbdD (DUF466 family)
MIQLQKIARHIWQLLVEACGEKDYERYRERALARGEAALAAEAFFLQRLERKYGRPSRCC